MKLLWLWILLGAIALAALLWLFIWFNNSCITTTRYKVKIEGASGKRVVHLSDLHGKNFGRRNARLMSKVAALKPDIIAITGDIIHLYTARNKTVALNTVSALKEIAPVIFISGNHEMRNKGYRFFRKDLMEAGAIVLDDETAEVVGITVTGLNCASLKNGTIYKIAPENKQLLLAHEPQYFESFVKAGFLLTLCGHAHGGQWRIPFTGKGLYAPKQGKFPKYTQGLHEKDGCKMIISRGLGNSEFPLRLFNRPEIVVIDLQ